MDKEGQNADAPVFQSDSIGNRATPEYFSNVSGGKKDKTKVTEKRTEQSRKRLFIVLGVMVAILLTILVVALILSFNAKPRGSHTDEEMPTTLEEVEARTYRHLYSDGVADYQTAALYLNDLIKDMEDLNQSEEVIFGAYVLRARLVYDGGLKERGINEALRLVRQADTEYKKYNAYAALYYMYNHENNTERRDFYGDLLRSLNVMLETEGEGGDPEDE